MLKKGDELFNRHAQGTTLNKMTEKAKRVKGGIGDDALSSQARTFLNSEKKTIGMDSKILTKLDDMIEGDPMKKIMRVGAQMKPSSASARGAVPTMISSIGGLSVGGPLGLAIAIAPSTLGAAFQGIVNQMTKSEFKRIQHAAINKGQRAIEDIMEEMTAKYAKGATAATLAATPQIEELSNEATSLYKMMTD